MKLSIGQKLLLTFFLFAVAIAGFMVKLPVMFRGNDKEMHTLFYFLAAAFLNILFSKRNILIHIFIFAFLYAFGIAIEYAQDYSNHFFHQRIHGRYDKEDVAANLKGIIAFSIVWISYIVIYFLYRAVKPKQKATG